MRLLQTWKGPREAGPGVAGRTAPYPKSYITRIRESSGIQHGFGLWPPFFLPIEITPFHGFSFPISNSRRARRAFTASSSICMRLTSVREVFFAVVTGYFRT